MSIEIKEIKSDQDLKRFIKFPLKLYKDHPCYVPAMCSDELKTLNPKINPSFKHCEARYWLAYKGTEVVGRIAGIINFRHLEKWNEPYIRFGWFDFIDDQQVSKTLLGAVEAWGLEKNLEAVHGPLGFTDLDREAMLIEGFNELGTLATYYNYAYYPVHMEQLGYRKDADWVEYELQVPETLDPRISRAANVVLKRNHLVWPDVRRKQDLLAYVPQLFEMINKEYSDIYGTVPLTKQEIQHYTQAYFGFVHPDFVPFILDEQDRMVAFGVVIPSLSKALQKCRGHLLPFGWWHILRALRHNHRADLYLIAVNKKYQGLGVNIVLMEHIYNVFRQRGITVVESNPELETNTNIQSQWKVFEKRQHKRRRCYIKHLA